MSHTTSIKLLPLCVGLLTAACSSSGDLETIASRHSASISIDVHKELMITDLSVVEDPVRTTWDNQGPPPKRAAWTFGRLIQQMSGTVPPSEFVMNWLSHWERTVVINGYTSQARPSIRELVIDPWLAESGGEELDLEKAPFRLLAIVNRLDLRAEDGPYGLTAGEARFIFGVLGPDGDPLAFTVILEYGVPAGTLSHIRNWGTRWHDLSRFEFGPQYNHQLQLLTDQFTGPNCPERPNHSCLNQLRTNEVPLSPERLWEMREFRISGATGQLEQAPTAQTPDAGLNGSTLLRDFILNNEAEVIQQTHTVPSAILAASVPAPRGDYWYADGVSSEARFGFSVTTCNGCHTGDTDTRFLHVRHRDAGVESELSAFLTGGSAPDPVTGELRYFNDLDRRAQDLTFVVLTHPHDLFGDGAPRQRRRPH